MLPGRTFSPDFLLLALLRGWKFLVIPTFVCGLGALFVSRFLPNQYQSETLIQIIPQRVPDSYVRSTVTTDIDERLKSISQQIKSRTRIEALITTFDLYPDARRTNPLEDVVTLMRKAIIVEVGPRGRGPRGPTDPDSFSLRFTYGDAQIAQRVTQELASWFIAENSRIRGMQANSTNEFLEAQLAEARDRLVAHEKKVEAFRERHAGRLPSQLQSNMQAIQSSQLELQSLVSSIETDRARKVMTERLYNDALTEIQTSTGAPAPAAATPNADPTAPTTGGTAREQLESARQVLARLEVRLTTHHPDVTRMRATVRDLEAKAAEEAKAAASATPDRPATTHVMTAAEAQRRERLSSLRAEMDGLTRQIAYKENDQARLRALIADYQSRINAVPGLESEWISLSRDYDTLQESYRGLLAKSEESKVAANLERQQIGEQFRVLDAPRVPSRPLSPQRMMINLGGLAVGLVLGLAFIALREFLDSTYRSESDVIRALSLPVLAVVPHVTTASELRDAVRRRRLVGAATAVVLVLTCGVAAALRLWRYFV